MPVKSRDNIVVWFEIPVDDFERAAGFYEAVLNTTLKKDSTGPYRRGFFNGGETAAKGCIIAGDGCKPGTGGTLVYVNADGKLEGAMRRVAKAGGEVVQDITPLPGEMGQYAIIRDTEGNRVGLHAC